MPCARLAPASASFIEVSARGDVFSERWSQASARWAREGEKGARFYALGVHALAQWAILFRRFTREWGGCALEPRAWERASAGCGLASAACEGEYDGCAHA